MGSVDVLRVTLPVNPFVAFTVMVSLPLLLLATDSVVAEGTSEKPGKAPTEMTKICVLLQELALVYIAT